ncbi:MAG: magnesium and cobalt transport protein CorA [Rhodobacteraceae bacterium HLUCCA12]|nr:MAG: magnesium and cobalt transport protein CorA [Rhodobacteraceae bacterium HLUCCA12]
MRPNHRPSRRNIGPRRRNPPGTPPGTLSVDPRAAPPRIAVMSYGADALTETTDPDPDALGRLPETDRTAWINVDGLGDGATLSRIATRFRLHPLAMEDAVNLHQRPKFEDYDNHHFVVLRMPGNFDGRFISEQVALFLGPDFVVTLQEHQGDVFDPVRRWLHSASSPIRSRRADYLAYALIDAVVDAYFPILEQIGETAEALEDAVIAQPHAAHGPRIHALKHELMAIRRAIWPMRDMIAAMLRDESALIADGTRVYLRDCHDHTIQLLEIVETYRELASGLVEIHLASISNRTNEVMQVLTLIATIFIPLTFVVGVYGMNFNPEAGAWNMPELNWRYGYPAVMAAMLAIALGLVIVFWRKGWIGRR